MRKDKKQPPYSNSLNQSQLHLTNSLNGKRDYQQFCEIKPKKFESQSSKEIPKIVRSISLNHLKKLPLQHTKKSSSKEIVKKIKSESLARKDHFPSHKSSPPESKTNSNDCQRPKSQKEHSQFSDSKHPNKQNHSHKIKMINDLIQKNMRRTGSAINSKNKKQVHSEINSQSSKKIIVRFERKLNNLGEPDPAKGKKQYSQEIYRNKNFLGQFIKNRSPNHHKNSEGQKSISIFYLEFKYRILNFF